MAGMRWNFQCEVTVVVVLTWKRKSAPLFKTESTLVNRDTEGALKSVCINEVSVLRGVRLSFTSILGLYRNLTMVSCSWRVLWFPNFIITAWNGT